MIVEAKQKGFYGGELRVPGERFRVESEDVEASWFEPVDKSVIARRNAAKSGKAKAGEDEKKTLMEKAESLGLKLHHALGIEKIKEAITLAEGAATK